MHDFISYGAVLAIGFCLGGLFECTRNEVRVGKALIEIAQLRREWKEWRNAGDWQ